MSYKCIQKVNQYPCIDLLAGKIFLAIEPAGGGASPHNMGLSWRQALLMVNIYLMIDVGHRIYKALYQRDQKCEPNHLFILYLLAYLILGCLNLGGKMVNYVLLCVFTLL